MPVHQNGINLTQSEIAAIKDKKQERIVEEALKRSSGKTTNELYDDLQEIGLLEGVPETSIRRTLTDLHNSKESKVYKTSRKREGRYGKDVHVYAYRSPQQQVNAFGPAKPRVQAGVLGD